MRRHFKASGIIGSLTVTIHLIVQPPAKPRFQIEWSSGKPPSELTREMTEAFLEVRRRVTREAARVTDNGGLLSI